MNDDGSERPAKDASTPDGRTRRSAPRRTFRSFLFAAVLALLALMATAGVKSYSDLELAREQERQLLEQIAEAKERIREVTDRIDRIENDPAMLERLAREELGMVREGDVVIVLPEDPEPAPAAVEPSPP